MDKDKFEIYKEILNTQKVKTLFLAELISSDNNFNEEKCKQNLQTIEFLMQNVEKLYETEEDREEFIKFGKNAETILKQDLTNFILNKNMDKENKITQEIIDEVASKHPQDVLKSMDEEEVLKFIKRNTYLLNDIDDDTLIDSISSTASLIDYLSTEDMISELRVRGFDVICNHSDLAEDATLELIYSICKKLKPRGFIDKNDAKNLICEFLDNCYEFKSSAI